MVGDGKYESCAAAAAKIIKKAKVYFPNEAKFAYYRAKHAKYKSIYPLIKQIED
jgi:sugar (pentulose or hexulose) kinase